MADASTHEIMEIALEDGVPTEPVPAALIRSALESDTASVRTQAATISAGLVEEEPETVAEVIPALVERLQDDQQVVIYQSTLALSQLAADHHDELEPAIGRLVELTRHDLPLVRMVASRTLGFVALERPELFTDHVETLVEATEAEPAGVFDRETLAESVEDPRRREAFEDVNRQEQTRQAYTRNVTVNLLIEVAEYDPSYLEPHAAELIDLLSDADATVARGCAEILGYVAREDPAAVADAVDPLLDMLAHPDDAVVATAITTLGFVGDPAAVEPLEDLADERGEAGATHSDDLYELAAETAQFLDAP